MEYVVGNVDMEVMTNDGYTGMDAESYTIDANGENGAAASHIALYIVLGVCIVLGVVLGIIMGKRAANK